MTTRYEDSCEIIKLTKRVIYLEKQDRKHFDEMVIRGKTLEHLREIIERVDPDCGLEKIIVEFKRIIIEYMVRNTAVGEIASALKIHQDRQDKMYNFNHSYCGYKDDIETGN